MLSDATGINRHQRLKQRKGGVLAVSISTIIVVFVLLFISLIPFNPRFWKERSNKVAPPRPSSIRNDNSVYPVRDFPDMDIASVQHAESHTNNGQKKLFASVYSYNYSNAITDDFALQFRNAVESTFLNPATTTRTIGRAAAGITGTHSSSISSSNDPAVTHRDRDSTAVMGSDNRDGMHNLKFLANVKQYGNNIRVKPTSMLFVHIPKAAGTSLTAYLRSIQCQLDRFAHKECCINPGSCYLKGGRRCMTIIGCVGHYPRMQLLNRVTFSAVMLREPAARAVSGWFYPGHNPNADSFFVRPYFLDIRKGKLPHVEFSEYITMPEYRNIQTRMLGNDDFPYSNSTVTIESLNRAQRALLSVIDFVGVQEEFAVSVQLLMRMKHIATVNVSAFDPSSYSSVQSLSQKDISKDNQMLMLKQRNTATVAGTQQQQQYNHNNMRNQQQQGFRSYGGYQSMDEKNGAAVLTRNIIGAAPVERSFERSSSSSSSGSSSGSSGSIRTDQQLSKKRTMLGDAMLMDKIRRHNTYDKELYRTAVKRFCSDLREYPDLMPYLKTIRC